jgi:IS5 family transposase
VFILTYPEDPGFLNSPVAQFVQTDPRKRALHDLVKAVWADPRVRLAVRKDLAPPDRVPIKPGAPALAAEVTVALAIVRRLQGWSYRVLASEVDGSVGWRWVCSLYNHPMPTFQAVQGREAQMKPKTLRLINQVVVELAGLLGLTAGVRLRLDATVTETNVHYPTDSSLLDDAARVLSRCVKRARALCGPLTATDQAWFRDRHRAAHHLAAQISHLHRPGAKPAKNAEEMCYRRLIGLVERLVAQVAEVQTRLKRVGSGQALLLAEALAHYGPLVQQVIDQSRRRVLEGQSVPAKEKLVSLFETHTAIIRRGKAKPKETEFGRKLWFAEVDGGLVTEWRILEGNPPDEPEVLPSVRHHRRLFHRAPREVTGDRALHSPNNERQARRLGVKRVCLPKPGYKTAQRRRYERQCWFRAARRFRAGIEGRISQLRRARRLGRCLNHGVAGLERWVGWGVIANNWDVIATYLNKCKVTLAEALS